MIIFNLKCVPQSHVFEAWFGSTVDYDSQQARGLVSCPICGSAEVGKAPMAPRVGAKGNRRAGSETDTSAGPEAMKSMLAALATAQRELLSKSDFVGDRFPEEARAIHLGEAEARSIHGRASRTEAEALAEEGISVAPLPFPVIEPGAEN
ncbi:MAG TPA: DUF1178 family protein [Allosphingosinicella sp.]|nr:DUF1178 family protein [Allosphingosinicella sp.]